MSRTKGKKVSQSQVLRGTFYKLWEGDNEGHEDFDYYYEEKMIAINEFYKKILNER